MNGRTRKKLYAILKNKYGGECRLCGARESNRQLVIDHIDNNNSNNYSDNLQLLCRPCNYQKNPRGSERPVDKCVNECKSELTKECSELSVNRTKEWQFREYVPNRIQEQGDVEESDLIYSGAEAVGVSPVTVKRYLNKMCSVEGKFYRRRVGEDVFIAFRPGI